MNVAQEVGYFIRLTRVKDSIGYASFYTGVDARRANLEVKVKCDIDFVEDYALRQGFVKISGRYYRKVFSNNDWEKYAKTLVYAVLLSRVKKPSKKAEISSRVDQLDYFDLKYWVGLIVSRYHKIGVRGTYRPAKALKILLNLD